MLSDVLLLSHLLGRPVTAADRRVIGRIADLSARFTPATAVPVVEHIVVRRRRNGNHLVPWHAVSLIPTANTVVISGDPEAAAVDGLPDERILLGRDVLDTQIVDTAGQRVSRVADIVLARTAQHRIEVVAVEVGFGAVLHRLGLHALGNRIVRDAVAWTDLHLTAEPGQSVLLAAPSAAVHRLDARGLAVVISRLGTDSASTILAHTPSDIAAGAVHAGHPASSERVMRALPDAAAGDIVAAMPAERARVWRHRLQHRPLLGSRRFLRVGTGWRRR